MLARCPTCGERVKLSNPEFPFCSERCRLIDLGHWLDGTYRISGEKADKKRREPKEEE
ncbi:MAG TPA: DNA gyrase inhibitor YacG [Acidobacteriota bacterium]|nr:DNA gyrase inhibitor YacG [Acidobacteriota bacterium]